MNNKIIMGSFVIVVILIAVPFTGVVGHSITKSSTNSRMSPLFSLRTNRAIDIESKDYSCEYLGEGKETTVFVPPSNDELVLFQIFIDKTTRMDDKTFSRFLINVVDRINHENKISDENRLELILSFEYLRKNPDDMIEYMNSINQEQKNRYELEQQEYTLFDEWKPGCLLHLIKNIFASAIMIAVIIMSVFLGCYQTYLDCIPCYKT